MKKETYNFIKDNIHKWEIDYKNGLILNRKIFKGEFGNLFSEKTTNVRVRTVIGFIKFGEETINSFIFHKDKNPFNDKPENLTLASTMRKFNKKQIFEIYSSDKRVSDISKDLGVSHNTIASIKKGKTYKDFYRQFYNKEGDEKMKKSKISEKMNSVTEYINSVLDRKDRKISEANKTNDKMLEEIKRLNNKRTSLQKEVKKKEKENLKLKEENTNLRNVVSELEKDLKDIREETIDQVMIGMGRLINSEMESFGKPQGHKFKMDKNGNLDRFNA